MRSLGAIAAGLYAAVLAGAAPASGFNPLGPSPRRRPRGQRLVHTSTVVDEATHRVPPRWRRMRSKGGKIVKELVPETTKTVPIRRAVHLDNSKDYRGRLGAKDKARREAALAVPV